eukprot:6424552-Prymnesium_polylepis.3
MAPRVARGPDTPPAPTPSGLHVAPHLLTPCRPHALTPRAHTSPHRGPLSSADDATDDELRRAYRKLAVKYHPDKQKDPESAEVRRARAVGRGIRTCACACA